MHLLLLTLPAQKSNKRKESDPPAGKSSGKSRRRSKEQNKRKDVDGTIPAGKSRRQDEPTTPPLSPIEKAVTQVVSDVVEKQSRISKDADALREEVSQDRELRAKQRKELEEKQKMIAQQLARAKEYADQAEKARKDAREVS